MRPILILGVQRLFDQHTAKAGAVDEEISFDDLARIEHERLDEAGIGILSDALDLPLDTLRAMALGELAQELRVNRGIEVIREVDIRLGGRREFLPPGGLQLQAVIAQFRLDAPGEAVQPEMVKLTNPGGLPVHAEGMDVALAGALPVLERDAKLEGRRGSAHELLLVDVEQSMERANGRNRRFAHADRADLFGLDQRNVQDPPELLRQRCCSHPSGGTTARDHDFLYFGVHVSD